MEKGGAEAPPDVLVLFWLVGLVSLWLSALVSRRKRVHVSASAAPALTGFATGVMMSMHALMMTNVMLVLGHSAMLTLLGLFCDVRIFAFIDVRRRIVAIPIAFHRRLDLTTLLVLCTRVLVMYTSMHNAVVMSFVTLHGSLLRSCSTE